ncbi:MAG: hypothetical protein JXR37_14810 [Kiritimatiellae bacterium]|nr:hypothetical protein [Kiritimatiellia bacterium]
MSTIHFLGGHDDRQSMAAQRAEEPADDAAVEGDATGLRVEPDASRAAFYQPPNVRGFVPGLTRRVRQHRRARDQPRVLGRRLKGLLIPAGRIEAEGRKRGQERAVYPVAVQHPPDRSGVAGLERSQGRITSQANAGVEEVHRFPPLAGR